MSQPSATQGAAVWIELRAEKVPGPGYSWVIEGRSDPASDPDDPESWGWVASVNGSEHVWDHEPGETARQLVLRWDAHAPLVEALEGCIALIDSVFPTSGAAITAEARAALALAMGEVA